LRKWSRPFQEKYYRIHRDSNSSFDSFLIAPRLKQNRKLRSMNLPVGLSAALRTLCQLYFSLLSYLIFQLFCTIGHLIIFLQCSEGIGLSLSYDNDNPVKTPSRNIFTLVLNQLISAIVHAAAWLFIYRPLTTSLNVLALFSLSTESKYMPGCRSIPAMSSI